VIASPSSSMSGKIAHIIDDVHTANHAEEVLALLD
jgi:hypothetical protein